MHTVGQSWVNEHEEVAESSYSQCATCHGIDYRGNFLSKTFTARSFSVEEGSKTYSKGDTVGCYDCHNGSDGE
jgi:nitrate/TMAO reductase-like tetraheme cytochrome c subunit